MDERKEILGRGMLWVEMFEKVKDGMRFEVRDKNWGLDISGLVLKIFYN